MRAGLCHQLPVDVEAPAVARRLLREWLTAWHWPPEEIFDVVLAVSEAVSNSVEHAAATRITVEAVIDPVPDPIGDRPAGFVAIDSPATATEATNKTTRDRQARRARIEVSDDGRWRHPIPTERYRGLALMRACMERVEVDATGRGTRVQLTSRPAHPALTTHRPTPSPARGHNSGHGSGRGGRSGTRWPRPAPPNQWRYPG